MLAYVRLFSFSMQWQNHHDHTFTLTQNLYLNLLFHLSSHVSVLGYCYEFTTLDSRGCLFWDSWKYGSVEKVMVEEAVVVEG
jgi:hypothetical protein